MRDRYEPIEDPNEVFYEQIESLEDCLDAAQERADENERVLTELFHAFHEAAQIEANKFWWEEPTVQELLGANCFECEPGKCISETSRVDGKSYCKEWERWTNCREAGHCTKGEQ